MRKIFKKIAAFVATAAMVTTICGTALAEDTYSVIGTINGNWDTDTDLVAQGDGTYSVVIPDVEAGSYEFKVRTNHEWDNGEYNLEGDASSGGANIVWEVTEKCDVTVTFDGEKVTVVNGSAAPAEDPADAPEDPAEEPADAPTAPQTGDATPVAAAVVAMLAMGCAVLVLNAKKAR